MRGMVMRFALVWLGARMLRWLTFERRTSASFGTVALLMFSGASHAQSTATPSASPEIVLLAGVPYLHQFYDTADSFPGGESCCNAAAALMAIQYYERLEPHPIACTRGGLHTSEFGYYVSNAYRFNGASFDARSSAVWGAALAGYAGGFGYFLQDAYADGAQRANRLAEYIAHHALSSAVDTDVAGERGFTKICAEIDAGHPVILLAGLAPAGHYLTCIGYVRGQHTLVFNDPAGDHHQGYPNLQGAGVCYDWPGWNHQNDNLTAVPRVIYARGAPVVRAPSFTQQPQSQACPAGALVQLQVAASGRPAPRLQWQRGGVDVLGAIQTTLCLNEVQPSAVGLYTVRASNSGADAISSPAIVGLSVSSGLVGMGQEAGSDIRHPNGRTFDQVLVTGAAVAINADAPADQMVRASFVDLDGDIVQVEFSGPGTLSLVLDGVSGRAAPEKYNQPDVLYTKGHAAIVIAGATEQTNVSVFTVGRATAYDPTGRYDILRAPGVETNNPANNGSSLFAGHATTDYDGIADLAFIAVLSSNGRFGGIRAANVHFFADKGHTGVYAPGVEFTGPVYVGDVCAFAAARPVLVLGAANDVRITGGDLYQENGQPVLVSGITQLRFTAGSDSHGRGLPAQPSRAVLLEDGVDVTARIAVNP